MPINELESMIEYIPYTRSLICWPKTAHTTMDCTSKHELGKHGYFVSQQFEVNFKAGPGFKSFTAGRPGEEILRKSAQELKKAVASRLTEELEDDCDLLQYGSLMGDPTYRIQLAKFLTRWYGSPVHSDNILCTAGASQGLNFVSSHFFSKGDLVFVEDPTYFLALASFRNDQELNVVAVPTDGEGIDCDALEGELEERVGARLSGDQRPFRSLLYLIPCFQNPTGTCTTPERSRKIVSLARKYDVLVVCDDVYNLLSWIPAEPGSPRPYQCPPRLFSFDDPSDPDFKGHVVSNCSVSKYLGPGLRVGWLEASPRILDLLLKSHYLDSGGCFNHVTAGFIGTMLKMGLMDTHLQYVCDTLKSSANSMVNVLKEEMPAGVKYSQPQGGYFVWMELPKTVNVGELFKLCNSKYKVNFAPGKNFSLGPNFNHCIRLSFSYYQGDQLVDGVRKLCQAVREILATNAQ